VKDNLKSEIKSEGYLMESEGYQVESEGYLFV